MNKIDETFNVVIGYYPNMTAEQAEALAKLLKEVFNEGIHTALAVFDSTESTKMREAISSQIIKI